MPPGRSRRIDGHFYPSAPEMPGICQSQASISEHFGKAFDLLMLTKHHLQYLLIYEYIQAASWVSCLNPTCRVYEYPSAKVKKIKTALHSQTDFSDPQ